MRLSELAGELLLAPVAVVPGALQRDGGTRVKPSPLTLSLSLH